MRPGGRIVEPFVGGLDRDAAAVGHGVARVDAQVQQGILELAGIDQGRPQSHRADHLERDLGADGAPDQLFHAGHQRIDVDRRRRQRLAPREGQQAVRERGGAPGGALRHRDVTLEVAEAPLAHPDLHQVERAGDPRQQVVEVVGQAAGELPHGLHLLGLAQLLFEVALGRRLDPDAGAAQRLPVLVEIGAPARMHPAHDAVRMPQAVFEVRVLAGGEAARDLGHQRRTIVRMDVGHEFLGRQAAGGAHRIHAVQVGDRGVADIGARLQVGGPDADAAHRMQGQAREILGLPQRFLAPVFVRQVAPRRVHPALFQGAGPAEPAPRAVLVTEAVFMGRRQRPLEDAGEGGQRRVQVVGMSELDELPADDLVVRIAQQLVPHRVDRFDGAIGPGDHQQLLGKPPAASTVVLVVIAVFGNVHTHLCFPTVNPRWTARSVRCRSSVTAAYQNAKRPGRTGPSAIACRAGSRQASGVAGTSAGTYCAPSAGRAGLSPSSNTPIDSTCEVCGNMFTTPAFFIT